jgi:hypothetical protein
MNKKVIVIFALTVIALVLLYLFSFGPLANWRTAHYVNPESQKPSTSEQVAFGDKSLVFNTYHNRDIQEDYYTINLPQDWQVESDKAAGSYLLHFADGSGKVRLMDVPDNSTLELYILSEIEPGLVKTLTDYKRTDFAKSNVNSAESYQLIYTSNINGVIYQTINAYIAGQDLAMLITFSVPQTRFETNKPLFSAIINSFQWEV